MPNLSHQTIGRLSETLELYGIEHALVIRCFWRSAISAEDLAIPVKTLNVEQVRQLAARSDVVINL